MSGSEPESQVPGGNWESSPVDVKWHESWEAFSAHMEEYYKRTHQIFRQRTSTSVAKRNREITARAARLVANSDEAQAEELIPEHFVNFWINRSKGIRTSYFDRDTGRKANIKAGVSWNDAEKKFMVRVTDSCVTHNHQVSKARFDNHASNRRVDDPSVLAFVDELQAAGSKPKLIMQYLRKRTGKKVVLRDVHKIVAKMRERRRGGVSVEKRLETVMRNFCKTRGNRTAVFVDDANTAQTITLQTRQMRRWFKAFPEVLLIDATHNTNESRFFSFMVNDVYGHLHIMYYRTRIVPLATNVALEGQYVHHSLMENECEECLTDAIQAFKSNNPSWQDVRVIVIDKDMGELSILEKEFGDVKVILCHFHLKKYFRTEMAKSEYGGRSSFDKDQVEDAVDLMRQATSIKEYTKYLKYMYFLLDGVQLSERDKIPEAKQPFLKYFMRNWHTIKERCALYARKDVPHLGNHTNNRLETSWGHIKDILKPDMALGECVDTLLFLQAVAEMEYAKKITEVGQMRYREADNELQNLACEVSPHAYRLVEKQYWIAMDRKTRYDVRELHPKMYELTIRRDALEAYHVNTSKYRCSCVFMRTMLLPCRHVMYWRHLSCLYVEDRFLHS
ncbi:Hypothetical protein PHPALM_17001 [Phytophthora palmivora]|uniref:SWIM-type domain-containing protein n=1 Tax=Phytophthora palmivora TaxID=4796 RepID=A0A2P4XNC0_9STRA|nr:Hypothetical protein PHPALM_17001 [Phytophthora palmivora]